VTLTRLVTCHPCPGGGGARPGTRLDLVDVCRLSVVTRGGRTVIVLDGELDLSARDLADQAAAIAGEGKLAGFVMDLGGITFIDVAGLEAVLDLHRAGGAALPVHLVAASPPVQRLIGLLEIGHAFSVEPDL
jgi:anti-anti-sigma factor